MGGGEIELDGGYKVGRVLSEYDLRDLHDQLPALWTGAGGDALSLRELAAEINVALLGRAMERAGEEPLEGEAENAYSLLTGDDVTAGVRTQQRNRLERDGVEVEKIESDFVTHQAVYTYLTTALGVSKNADEGSPTRKQEQRIQRLRSRTAAVTENSLAALEESNALSFGSPEVIVNISVYCRDCGTQYDFVDLLDRKGCNCE